MADNRIDELETKLDGLDAEESAAIKDSNANYDTIIKNNNALKDEQLNKIGVQDENGNWNKGSWAATQTDIQNKQTDFAIDKIEQQKEWAEKDYQKEQRGAWKDYQKSIDPYGVNAENMASAGLSNLGYSENAKVAKYVAYQNRVATARESFQRSVAEFNNSIAEARLQNSAALAQIALDVLEKSMEVSLTFAQQNNTLLLEKAAAEREISNNYFTRWATTLDQINAEKSLELSERSVALDEAKFAYQKAQDAKSSGGIGKKFDKSLKTKQSMKKISAGKTALKKGKKTSGKTKTVDEKSEIDMQSVLNLGRGPISAQKLNQLVKEGKAVETKKKGKIAFEPRFNW